MPARCTSTSRLAGGLSGASAGLDPMVTIFLLKAIAWMTPDIDDSLLRCRGHGISLLMREERDAVGRSLVYFRFIPSILGSLVGLLGLSVVSRRVIQAVRTLRPQPSIHIVGPPTAGKTTLFQYLRDPSWVGEPRRTSVRRRTGRIAVDFEHKR
jgi:hypothetical protein